MRDLDELIEEKIEEKRRQAKLEKLLSVRSPPPQEPEKIQQPTPSPTEEPDQQRLRIADHPKDLQHQQRSRVTILKIPGEKLRALCSPPVRQSHAKIEWGSISGLSIKKRKVVEVESSRNGSLHRTPSSSQRSPKRAKPSSSTTPPITLPQSGSDKESKFGSTTKKDKRELQSPSQSQTPEWYANVDNREKHARGDLQQIAHIKALITNCIDTFHTQKDTNDCFTALREKLHDLEFYPFLNELLIKKSKVLDSEGLSRIFDGPSEEMFPIDIKLDAEHLWRRWMAGDIDGDLMRGIEKVQGKRHAFYTLKATYAHKKKPANAVGENGLMNGQWWPNRICAWRDGAHGEQEAGIHGQTGNGAYSIVVSSGYEDVDSGEVIEYCGTKSHDSKPTKCTSLMLDSLLKKQPLRVLRAANNKSKYAPEQGIRYDGLYQITTKEMIDPASAMLRFRLKRIKDQNPIRWSGVEKRPTRQELLERMRIRKLL